MSAQVRKINQHDGGKIIPGAMNRPTKHDQDDNGNVMWWDNWKCEWVEAAYDSCRHGVRYTHWRMTGSPEKARGEA